MRVFALKQNQSRQKSSTNLPKSNTLAGSSHADHPLQRLQRTIGNQAVLRLLQDQAGSPVQARLQRAFGRGGESPSGDAKSSQTGLTDTSPADSPRAEAPSIVNDALTSPGHPLDPQTRTFMEPRLGHDFSGVRIHSGPLAAQSARAMNANAYTVGHDIVFGADRFAPGTDEGRRLIAHELTHVVQRDASDVVRRDLVQDSSGKNVSYEFRIGHELTEAFAKQAKKLTADGKLSDADIVQLKASATKARDTVSDHERMFMAGLLDATNVATLKATKIDSKASLTFALSTITDARVKQVIETGQPTASASELKTLNKLVEATGKQDIAEMNKLLGELETAADKEIRSLVGASFKTQIAAVITYAQVNGIQLTSLLAAMRKAASDDTPSDRLMAAAAYAIAAAVKHPLEPDLAAGKIRMDALAPAKFSVFPGFRAGMRAAYMPAAPINPSLAGLKGDTIYMPTDFDIANLEDRSTVIHELVHAQDDKAASPTKKPTSPKQLDLEVKAYKAQARYTLDQMHSQTAAERAVSAKQVGTAGGDLELLGVLIVAKTDLKKYQPLVEQLFAAAPAPRTHSAADVAKMLANSSATLESALEKEILKTTGITATSTTIMEGQAGESLIHWIHRL